MSGESDNPIGSFDNFLLFLSRLFMIPLALSQAAAKYANFDTDAKNFADLGLPQPDLLVMLVVVLGGLVAIMLLIGFTVRFAALLLFVFVALDLLLVRLPTISAGDLFTTLGHNGMVFTLDLATMGGCLALMATGAGSWRLIRRRH